MWVEKKGKEKGGEHTPLQMFDTSTNTTTQHEPFSKSKFFLNHCFILIFDAFPMCLFFSRYRLPALINALIHLGFITQPLSRPPLR